MWTSPWELRAWVDSQLMAAEKIPDSMLRLNVAHIARASASVIVDFASEAALRTFLSHLRENVSESHVSDGRGQHARVSVRAEPGKTGESRGASPAAAERARTLAVLGVPALWMGVEPPDGPTLDIELPTPLRDAFAALGGGPHSVRRAGALSAGAVDAPRRDGLAGGGGDNALDAHDVDVFVE